MHTRPALYIALTAHVLVATALQAQAPSARGAGALPTGPGRIAGVVVSLESNQPLQSAAITVRGAPDSLIVAGSLTSANGQFRIEGLAPGKYWVHVSMLGYRSSTTAELLLTPAAPMHELGSIRLEVMPVSLPGLDVQGARAPVVLAPEGTVYNTKDLPSSAGSAIDVLRSVPELEVDMQGRIALRGTQSVAIHLNGRAAPLRGDQLTSFLQQLPGNRVVKVEVMPNPSAKHDPEGMGGIVNIVMRENVDLGVSGSLSAAGSTLLRRDLTGRFNYQNGRLTLFSGGSLAASETEAVSYDLRENLLAQPVTFIEQDAHRVSDALLYNLDVTAEWRLNRQSVLWASGWWTGNLADNQSLTTYGLLDGLREHVDLFDRRASGGDDATTGDATLGFKHVIQPQQHEFTIDVRVARGRKNSDIDLVREFQKWHGSDVSWPQHLTFSDIGAGNRSISLQADYVRPLTRGSRLELGYRAWQRSEDSDNLMEKRDLAESEDAISLTRTAYEHDEIFHSVYTMVTHSRGRLSMQAGVRAELAKTTFGLPVTSQIFENDYNSVFPSANLSFDLGQGRLARLSYGKRISRPTPYILNPSVPNDDELNLFFGNPYLKPTYTHSLNLDLSWTGQRGTLRAAPYYRKTVDNWDQLRTVDATGASTMTWANSASLVVYGAALTASLRPTNRLSGSASLGGYREVRDASNISDDYSQSALRWSAALNAGYQVLSTLSAFTNLRYAPPVTLIQGRSSGMFISSIGLRQQLWSGKGSLNLFASDPLDLYRFNFETRDFTHTQTSRTVLKQRALSLSLTYNFGRTPPQNSRRQSDTDQAPGTIIR